MSFGVELSKLFPYSSIALVTKAFHDWLSGLAASQSMGVDPRSALASTLVVSVWLHAAKPNMNTIHNVLRENGCIKLSGILGKVTDLRNRLVGPQEHGNAV
jgi:hypothetical protein